MSKLTGVKASTVEKRLKMLLWGESGTGKTTLALQFPNPYVIDLERGTDHYGDKYDFTVVKTNEADTVLEQIEALMTEKHDYKTLIIDPITVFWDAFQRKWTEIISGVKTKKSENGKEPDFYELQFGDWKVLNAEYGEFMRMLMRIDMNLICTAHSKTAYKKGSMAVVEGVTWDAQKDTDYYFDTTIQLYIRDGVHYGVCTKDKSGHLPTHVEFEPSFDYFAGYFGSEKLNRSANVIEFSTEEQRKRLLELQKEKGISDSTFRRALDGYNVRNTKGLTKQQADELITRIDSIKEKINAAS